MNKWLKMLDIIIEMTDVKYIFPNRPTAPRRSMTWCVNVGIDKRVNGRHSEKSTCFFSVKTWGTILRTKKWTKLKFQSADYRRLYDKFHNTIRPKNPANLKTQHCQNVLTVCPSKKRKFFSLKKHLTSLSCVFDISVMSEKQTAGTTVRLLFYFCLCS